MADPKLVDMAYTKAEIKEEAREMKMGEPSPYPWGLCLHLDKDELDKLGIATLPQVGAEMHLIAVAKVTSVNESAREGQDENRSIGLQITMMQVAPQATPAAKSETPAAKKPDRKVGTLLQTKG